MGESGRVFVYSGAMKTSHRIQPLFLSTAILCTAILCTQTAAAQLPHVSPADVGINAEQLARIDGLVAEHLAKGKMPGCVVTIGHAGSVVFQRAYGHRQLEPDKVPMTVDTVFDLASLTKPIATGTSIMCLIDQGRLRLSDKIAAHLPEFGENGKDKVTVKQLLTHVGGLIPDNPIGDYDDGVAQAWQNIWDLELTYEPGGNFSYTDVGFIVLAKLVEKLTDKNVDEFARENVFQPLGMSETGYLPAKSLRARAATTEQREGRWMKGEVHDPRAYALGGVAGHAGLFSTADDLSIYAQMMLGRGKLGRTRILSGRAFDVMTSHYQTPRGIRGLGWDIRSPYSSNRSDLYSDKAFGHGGFTGTAIWMDPELDLFVIFLANRVHPNGRGHVNYLASRIGSVAVSAMSDPGGPALDDLELDPLGDAKVRRPATVELVKSTAVLCGIDRLQANGFRALTGKRVGLITNHTGLNCEGVSTVRLLHEAEDVTLVRLYSPEHGLEGKLDIPEIGNSKEEQTGLEVFSLYGETRKPTQESLEGIDVLVFDIQDIGARFYTYISTMGLAMDAAAESGVEFVVLDRPNPIGGMIVDGPIRDSDVDSFVAFHTLPVQHGMTVGEIARMLVAERAFRPSLDVILLDGWRRRQLWDETGLTWTNPSPNMRCLTQAILYPGIGLLETTNLSVGRGTDTPFEVIGAPWIHHRELAASLNGLALPGVRFVPIRFSPDSSKFANEDCQGINIIVTDRNRFESVRTGLAIATQLREQYPEKWKVANYNRLLANRSAFEAVKRGDSAAQIVASYRADLDKFLTRRAKYLLYD